MVEGLSSHTTMRILYAILSCLAALSAQEASYPVATQSLNLDSGFLANTTPLERVVWTQDVSYAADWVQLRFADTHLPAGSSLRIFPLAQPDWVQRHDARSVVDYQGYSCQFLGPTLRVELVAGPNTTANRTRIDLVVGMQVGQVVEYDTICGPTDDRVLASDVRACRINASCTAWLFSEFAVGTAGHCMTSGTAGKTLHFNVPLSSATGGAIPAHPNDQYAVDTFLQSMASGVGQDWAAMAAVPNSNTGLYPGQAQGSWYDVIPAPAFSSSQQIRITGFGSGNGVSGSPTWNLVQKTHLGNRVTTSTASALRYDTDTTGGNSGSPVILESTGQVIGVHTHGGCTATGGGNSGTDAIRPDFTAARAQAAALHTIGSISPFGSSCGAAQPVSLTMTGAPEFAQSLNVVCSGLDPFTPTLGWFAVGASNASWNGLVLPAGLDGVGIEGCQLLVGLDFVDSVVSTLGVAFRVYTLPNDPGIVGLHLYFQWFGFAPSATTSMGVAASNGIDLKVGD